MKNFTLKSSNHIPEIRATVHEFEHEKTKAKVIWIERKDEEQAFTIAFRTPPYKDTGLTHILEHMVLAGSEKYRAKDPFFSMNKNSVKSFMNAITYIETTLYLFSSANKKDLLNLQDVYLDSVFKPLLLKEIFLQEGWRYEIENNQIKYSGVVFNEMKGAGTNLDLIKIYAIIRALFPDSLYLNNYGGEPISIPTLSYEELIDYHKKYYHPSNSITVIYSETEIDEILGKLNNYFEEYESSNVLDLVQKEYSLPDYSESERIEPYQAEGELDNLYKAFRLEPAESAREYLERYFLYCLFWNDKTGILYRRLLESKLVNNLASGVCMYDTQALNDFFCFGGDGIKRVDLKIVKEIINETFNEFHNISISNELISSLLNKIEFDLRELRLNSYSENYSKGLDLCVKSIFVVEKNLNLISMLSFDQAISELKENLRNREYLNTLVKENFVDNKLQSIVVLEPDPKYQEKKEQEIQDKLSKVQTELTRETLEQIEIDNKKLKELHEAPNDESTLPKLSISDISRDYSEIKYSEISQNIWNMQSTKQGIYNFIIQYILDIDAKDIQDLVLFSRVFQYLDTKTQKNYDLGMKTNQVFGRLSFGTSTILRNKENYLSFEILGSVLTQNLQEAINLLQENLREVIFDKDIIFTKTKESLEEMKNTVLDEGHIFSLTRSMSKLSDRQAVDELRSGLSYIDYLESLTKNFDSRWESLENTLSKFKQLILNKSERRLFVMAPSEEDSKVLVAKLSVLDFSPLHKVSKPLENLTLSLNPENFKYETSVNYVAQSFRYNGQMDGSMIVVKNLLARKFLFEEIRVKGGAYGAMCQVILNQNIGALVSYRDPNREKTLDIYEKAIEYLKVVDIPQEEFESLVIGSSSLVDNYEDDDMKFATMISFVNSEKDWKFWNNLKHELIDTTQEKIRELARNINLIDGTQVIIGGE